MKMHTLRIALILLPVLIASRPADATVYTGTFTGIVEGSRINAQDPVNAGNIDGERASGTFSFDTDAYPTFTTATADSTYYFGMPVSLSFNVHGTSLDFPSSSSSSLYLNNTGATQGLTATANDGPYWSASVSFGGSSLFTNNNPSSFNPTSVDVSGSRANFFAGRDFGGSLRLDGLSFDGFTMSAPAPGSWMLVLPGLAWMGWSVRRRRFNRR
jgi:hypothetical protein